MRERKRKRLLSGLLSLVMVLSVLFSGVPVHAEDDMAHLAITYHLESEDGNMIAEPYYADMPIGSTYNVSSPEIENYVLKQEQQKTVGGILDKDTEIKVVYTYDDSNEFKYTVKYVGYTSTNTEVLLDAVEGSAPANTIISVPYREFDGFAKRGGQDMQLTVTGDDKAEKTVTYDKLDNPYIIFQTNGSYVEPITAAAGSDISDKISNIKSPTRQGYKFEDWDIEIPNTMPKEDLIINAEWTPIQTNYTVAIWVQNNNDDEYTLLKTEKREGTTEDTVEATDEDKQKPEKAEVGTDFYGLEYEKCTPVEIKGDGTSVLNIYYTRQQYTINIHEMPEATGENGEYQPSDFEFENQNQAIYKTITGRYGYRDRATEAEVKAYWQNKLGGDDDWAFSGFNRKDSKGILGELLFIYEDETGSKTLDVYPRFVKKSENTHFIMRRYDETLEEGVYSDEASYVYDSYQYFYKDNGEHWGISTGNFISIGEDSGFSFRDKSSIPSRNAQIRYYFKLADGVEYSSTYGKENQYDWKNITTSYSPYIKKLSVQDNGKKLVIDYRQYTTTGTSSSYYKEDPNGNWVKVDSEYYNIIDNPEYGDVGNYPPEEYPRYSKMYYGDLNGGDLIIEFRARRLKFDVTYIANGETIKTTENVFYEAPVDLGIVPENIPEGHTFAGWTLNTNNDLNSEVLESYKMPAGDLTLVAKFIPIDVNVHFDSQGGSSVDSQKVAYNSKATLPQTPVRAGYEFAGWYTEAQGGQKWSFDRPVENDITLYSHWRPISKTSYTIKHIMQGEQEPFFTETLNGSVGDTVVGLPLDPKNENYPKDIYLKTKDDSTNKSLILKENADENVITFTYIDVSIKDYTVRYLNRLTDEELNRSKTVTTKNTVVTENAVDVENFKVDGDVRITQDIKARPEIIFYYVPSNLKVTYQFKSGTDGRELPETVTALTPVDDKQYVYGDTASLMTPEQDIVTVDDGQWIFKGYQLPKISIVMENNVTITGYWEFKLNGTEINLIPVITANDKTFTVGDEFNNEIALKDVTAYDEEDGDVTASLEVLDHNVDTSVAGTYYITYRVTDKDGASSVKTIKVVVKDKEAIPEPAPEEPAKPETPQKPEQPAMPVEKPDSNIPQTGDSTNVNLWISLIAVSGIMLTVFGIRRKKKQQ